MTQPRALPPTPSQTVGPFHHAALVVPGWEDSDEPDAVTVTGTLLDGAGQPVTDALLEAWRAAAGQRPGGFVRVATDAAGHWRLRLGKPAPGSLPGGGVEAPHLAVSIFARGLLDRVVTRIYFADEATNADDQVLSGLATDRRDTVIAHPVPGGYHLDIYLQGERETVFFDS